LDAKAFDVSLCVGAVGSFKINGAFEFCAVGSFKSQEGDMACTPCPTHTTTLEEGAEASSECVCLGPMYKDVSASDGTCGCSAGFYVASSGNCELCLPDTYCMGTSTGAALRAWYKLSSDLTDSISSGAPMTNIVPASPATFANGVLAPGARLNFPARLPTNSDCTLAFWVKVNVIPTSAANLFTMGTSSSYINMYFRDNNERLIVASGPTLIVNHGVSGPIDGSGTTFVDTNVPAGKNGWKYMVNEWWHYTISAKNNVVVEYFNGQPRSSVTVDGHFVTAPPAGILGAHLNTYTLSATYRDFRIYGAALTASEIGILGNLPTTACPSNSVSDAGAISLAACACKPGYSGANTACVGGKFRSCKLHDL